MDGRSDLASGPVPPSSPPHDRRFDLWLGSAIAVTATILYLFTSSPDWIWDTLRYADWMNRAQFDQLVLIVHPLANLLPMGVFIVTREIAPGFGSLEVLEVTAAVASGLALAVTYFTARRLGGSVLASFVATAGLGVTLGVWRAGASGGVYGLSLLALAGAWWLAALYFTHADTRRAMWVGIGGGVCVATHLALVMALPALALLVVGLAGEGLKRKLTRMMAFVVGTGTAALLWLLSAGVARGWRFSDMLGWLIGSHGSVADPSASVGWGLRGLMSSIAAPGAPGRLSGLAEVVAIILTILIVLACFGSGTALLARAGRRRLLGTALLCNAVLAFVAASWYQSLRPDYFTLGLVPLALLWPAGRAVLTAGRPRIDRRLAAISIVPVAVLAIWNTEMGVMPTLEVSRQRATAARSIIDAAPRDSRLVLSPSVMPFVAYAGLDARTGWGALLQVTGSQPVSGGAPSLVDDLVDGRDQLLVSSRSFHLLPSQESHLRVSELQLWAAFRACCRLEPIAYFETERGVETLYLVTSGRAS